MATPNPEPVFVKELADKYKCSICTNLLDTPVLTECCGQHFCKACLEKWITKKKATIFPQCRAENFNKIVSQPIIREIKQLGVYCTNRDNGCKVLISYGDFPKHVNECTFGYVKCTNNCDTARLLRKDLEHHCKQECPNRIVHCELCNEEGKHCRIVGRHKRTCPNVIVACPNKCNEKLKRKDIEEHRKECPLEIVDCPFKEAGCEVRLPRKNISDHEASSMQNHLRLTMTTMVTANTALAHVKRENKELKRDFDTLVSVVSTGFSSMDISPTDTKPMNGMKTILTSLTTMIQPDGKTHCVHITDKLGLFEDPEKSLRNTSIIASSPPLCVYPGFIIYLGVSRSAWKGTLNYRLLLEKSDIHGYPEKLSIKVQPTTGRPFSCSLNDLKKTNTIRCDSGRELKLTGFIYSLISSDLDFYVDITFLQ